MDGLRATVIEELNGYIDRVPDLAPHEFTLADFQTMLGLRPGKARRELDRLKEQGIVAGGDPDTDGRYDQRSRRRVVAYWRVEGEPQSG